MKHIINIVLFITCVPVLALYVFWDVTKTAWMREAERVEA
jgi:hypothetical protein